MGRVSRIRRGAAARVLGGFLARLHALPLDGLMLPGDTLERTSMARRLGQIEERLDALRRRGVIRSATPWLELFSQAEQSARARPAAIVHAHLYARHFIVDEADAVVGVIDRGDIHAGDTASI